jgi:hypothetical protein
VKPYAAAAKRAAEAVAVALPSTAVAAPLAAPAAKPKEKGAYQPDHISISSEKPYDTAGKMQSLEQKLKDGKIDKKLFDELARKQTEAEPTKPVSIKKSYQPDYMYLRSEKPYDGAAKLLKLEQKLREGKISKRLYEELKGNYV